MCRDALELKSPGEDTGVLWLLLSGNDAEGGRWVKSKCV